MNKYVYLCVCLCVKNITLSAASPGPHQEAFWETKAFCELFFCNTQKPKILCKPQRNPSTSSCRGNWYGWSIWFQSLGKLVSPPPRAGQRQMTDQRNSSQKRMYKQTEINPWANTAVSVAGIDWFFSDPATVPLTLRTSLGFFSHLSRSRQAQSRHPFCCPGDVSHFSGPAGWWLWESVRRGGERGGGESLPGCKQTKEFCHRWLLWHWGPGQTSCGPRDLG